MMDELPDAEAPEAEKTAQDRDARPWVKLIKDAQACFHDYQQRADNIDKEYGNLRQLAEHGEREMQMFWANLEVIKPSIYAREPVPVVTPRFKRKDPVARKASEILERALISTFEHDHLHETLLLVRDDLATNGRGAVWLSVQMRGETPVVATEHVERCDFLHGPARKWREVPWVARRVHLNHKQMRERFEETAPQHWWRATFEERGTGGDDDEKAFKGEKTAQVWELWHKAENVVVWVCEGVEEVLDIQPPLYDLEEFFPCPKPAFGTLQRGTMIPVPDFLYYKDQLEEINELTARISALTEALIVRGFYPQGAGDISESIEMALASQDKRQLLIGVPNLQAFASGSGGKLVEMWPVDQVAATIVQLQELRRQLIDDVYQITGISDIMRGDTQASETATAQNIKAQFGSVRVRSRQEEMVRLARDLTRIAAEIMAEQFDGQALLTMSQVDDAPPMAQIQQQAGQFILAAQQGDQGAAQKLQELQKVVTIDAVAQLLQAERNRPFVLEIETDSTIQPDENAEKQRRTEFIAAVGGLAQSALPMVQQFPQSAEIVVEMLKFAAGGFRAGRDLDNVIDEFGEQAKAMGAQMAQRSQQPTPDQEKTKAETQKIAAETQKIASEAQGGVDNSKAQIAAAELQLKREEMQARLQMDREKMQAELELKRAALEADIQLKQATAAANAAQRAQESELASVARD